MNLDLKTSQELCDWLLQRGLKLSEAANVLCDLTSGHSFGVALVNVFSLRNNQLEKAYDKVRIYDWGDFMPNIPLRV